MGLKEKARVILLAAGATEDEADMIAEDACHVFEGVEGGKELVNWLVDELEELHYQGPAFEVGEDGRLLFDGKPTVTAGKLTLGMDSGGPRYYLLDRPVHSGVELLLLIEDGFWVLGRFEWNHKPSERPTFHINLGGSWEDLKDHPDIVPVHPRVVFELPEDAVLTWLHEIPSDDENEEAVPERSKHSSVSAHGTESLRSTVASIAQRAVTLSADLKLLAHDNHSDDVELAKLGADAERLAEDLLRSVSDGDSARTKGGRRHGR